MGFKLDRRQDGVTTSQMLINPEEYYNSLCRAAIWTSGHECKLQGLPEPVKVRTITKMPALRTSAL